MSLAGIETIQNDEPQIEFEFDAEGNMTVEDESTEDISTSDDDTSFYRNLVSEIDETVLCEVADWVINNVNSDENSREAWLDALELGFDLLGVEVQEKNEPFIGACSAQHPLMLESAVKFQSKASAELLPANGPVRTKIFGDHTLEAENRSMRVKKHMNWQITEKMTEYYIDTEKALLYCSLIGSGFKKTYYSQHLDRPVSEFVPADQLIVPNSASDLYRAPRFTHVLFKTEDELNLDCASGFYVKPKDYALIPSQLKTSELFKKSQAVQGIETINDETTEGFTLYEHYCNYYFEGLEEDEGDVKEYKLALPYIITVDVDSEKVIGIRRNWDEGDKKFTKNVIFSHYGFVPSFGFYHFGFIHLLGNLQLSLTSSLRSLIDAGQFANLQGGFKLKGVRIADSNSPIQPGEFKDIEVAIQDINKAIMPLPFKEPSQTLFAMLQFLDVKGQKFADSTEQVIADSTNYGPVGTTLALLDASTKFFSAIHKRLHFAQKHELRLIAGINARTLPENPEDYEYNVGNDLLKITREDYDDRVDVVPVSDPNISSNAHRMAKAQTVQQIAVQSPEQHDMREVLKYIYSAMEIENIDKLLPPKEEAQPNDPLTDIMFSSQGKPIKAFEGQDHESHIAVKTAFLQNPEAGGNPAMAKIGMFLQANIQEHIILKFMSQTKAQAANNQVTEAEAAQQVAQMSQQKLQQQMQDQSMQDSEKAKAEAAKVLAQSEIMDAENAAKKIELDNDIKNKEIELKYATLDVEKLKEINKMMVIDAQMAQEMKKVVLEKGLDATIKSLEPPKQEKQPAEKPKTESKTPK